MSVLYKNSSGDVVSLIPEINNIDDSTIAADTTYSSEKIEGSYPITTTATGSDLTLSTSSGNLNALTVYGKSEVVNNEIVSAGEGWSTVDLGTLNWNYISWQGVNYISSNTISAVCKHAESDNVLGHIFTSVYPNVTRNSITTSSDHVISLDSNGNVNVVDSTYSDATTFKTAMSGVLLCYQLADPTQGNCIAIKTDSGSGIDSTMATFTTGTPLRGIPDTTVRDVMVWDGNAGTVVKKCGKVKLSDLNWSLSARGYFLSDNIDDAKVITGGGRPPLLIPNYTPESFYNIYAHTQQYDKVCAISNGETVNPSRRIYIIDKQYATVADFTQAINALSAVYQLDVPTTQTLTSTENASLASLRTFTPSTHVQNNAGADMAVNAYARTANGKAVNAVNAELDSMINDSAATNTSTYSSEKIEDLLDEAIPKKIETPHMTTEIDCGVAEDVAFTGLTYFRSNNIWTDGTDVYYSYATDQYVLSPLTRTWTAKTWTGLTDFYGGNIWTDGENIYYSYNENQYVLDKSTSTWSAKTWNGLSSFGGSNTWTDGENIYYSGSSNQYVLDKSTSTWLAKTWSNLPNYFNGSRVWSDGENIYYSAGTSQHVLDKDTSTWKAKTWNGLTSFSGDYIWTDGKNIYYSKNQEQYVLNKLTSTWIAKTWINTSYLQGTNVWTDGETLYCTENNNVHKKLTPSLTYKSVRLR